MEFYFIRGYVCYREFSENALHRSGNPFIHFRYCLSWIRLAETNPEVGLLVSIGLGLALAVGRARENLRFLCIFNVA